MPAPPQRDLSPTRDRLTEWLSQRLPHAHDLSLGAVTVPEGVGFSNETLFFDASWISAEGFRRRRRLVARIAQTAHRVFPDCSFRRQLLLQELLERRTDVPVPSVLWQENSAEVLGAPFFIMARIDGRTPADLPSYHRQGWVAELPPHLRGSLWLSCVDILARIHAIDTSSVDFGFLDRPEHGPGGLTQQLDYYEENFSFFSPEEAPARAALRRLRAERPQEPDRSHLLWGDARLGNVIFRGVVPEAVVDWEMAALGPPEADLAWFLHLDRFLSEGIGHPRLKGFPGREETVRYYESVTGRKVMNLGYYELLAALRFCLITARVSRLVAERGLVPAGTDLPLHRNATRLLEWTLHEQPT